MNWWTWFRGNAAKVLGLPAADINAGRVFQELGFDSLTAVSYATG